MATTLTVRGMTCDGCEDIVETALEEVAGVESAAADRSEDVAVVEGDADAEALVEAVDFAGYEASTGAADADEGDEAETDADEGDADEADEAETDEE